MHDTNKILLPYKLINTYFCTNPQVLLENYCIKCDVWLFIKWHLLPCVRCLGTRTRTNRNKQKKSCSTNINYKQIRTLCRLRRKNSALSTLRTSCTIQHDCRNNFMCASNSVQLGELNRSPIDSIEDHQFMWIFFELYAKNYHNMRSFNEPLYNCFRESVFVYVCVCVLKSEREILFPELVPIFFCLNESTTLVIFEEICRFSIEMISADIDRFSYLMLEHVFSYVSGYMFSISIFVIDRV